MTEDQEIEAEIANNPEAAWISQKEFNRIFNTLGIRGLAKMADIPGGWVGMLLPDGRMIRVDCRIDDSHGMDEYAESIAVPPETMKRIVDILQKFTEIYDLFVGGVPGADIKSPEMILLDQAAGAIRDTLVNQKEGTLHG